jgi:hypothetical protein
MNHNLTLGCLYDVHQHWKSRNNSNSWSWLTFGLVHYLRFEEEEGEKNFSEAGLDSIFRQNGASEAPTSVDLSVESRKKI